MNLREIEAQAKALGPVIKSFVIKLLDPLDLRLKALEARQPEKGDQGPAGKDADPEQIKALIGEALPALVQEAHESLEARLDSAVKAIPTPENGKDGAPGADGKDGAAGADGKDGASVTADDVLPTLKQEVKRLFDALPVPKDGHDGKDGEPGRDGADGKSVTVEEVQELLVTVNEATFAKWALEFERRAVDMMERAVERLPKPANGKDGLDGFGFDDLSVEHDGTGGVTLRFVRGEHAKEFSLQLPVFIDRGVWREDTADYRKGDGVTFGGSFYIAQKELPAGKPGESGDWRLAVKKGRDGRNAA